jgi:hypothetical protein
VGVRNASSSSSDDSSAASARFHCEYKLGVRSLRKFVESRSCSACVEGTGGSGAVLAVGEDSGDWVSGASSAICSAATPSFAPATVDGCPLAWRPLYGFSDDCWVCAIVRVGVDAPEDELEMFRFDGRSEVAGEALPSRPESYDDSEDDENKDERRFRPFPLDC